MDSIKNQPVGRLRKGAWTKEEDDLLRQCIEKYGEGRWHLVPLRAGLNRCRKSCRLRWLNYLRPNIKRGCFNKDEVDLIVRLHKLLGNRWSLIAGRIPGRTANDVKNFWNTHVEKKLSHKSSSKDCHVADRPHQQHVIKPRPRTFSLKPPTAEAASNLGGANLRATSKQEPPCLVQTTASSSSSSLHQQVRRLHDDDESMVSWWRNLLDEASTDDDRLLHQEVTTTFDSFLLPCSSNNGWDHGEEDEVDRMMMRMWCGPCGNDGNNRIINNTSSFDDLLYAGDDDAHGKIIGGM